MRKNIISTVVIGLFVLSIEGSAASVENMNVNDMSTINQLATIKQGYSAIKYIENPAKEVQLAAIKESYHAIKLIKNPSKEVQLAAIKESFEAIKFIKNPSNEVQLAAVKQSYYAIKLIKEPSNEARHLAYVKIREEN